MRRLTQFKAWWRQSPHLRIGLVMFTLVALVALFAPLLETHDPYRLSAPSRMAPGGEWLLGTDALGGDIYSMIIEGSRTSLKVGFIAALISGVIGVLVGGVSGFLGGKTDRIVSEIVNIFLMLPTFFLVLMTVALFGSSMTNVMIIIGLTSWPGNARLMRVQAMSLKERVFVRSAEALGESRLSILFRYIIPNGIFPVITNTAMGVAGAILMEASLSFIGLGDPNIVSWGQMVYAGKSYMTSAWWVSLFPGLAIIFTVMSIYLICDGLNHVLNPKNARREA
ncbi:MAG: ABC transporter permease [Clostridia bacterium]|nr:ABC transporter permease [Clostridia bacterium]